MNEDDQELVALIDNELDETRKSRLLARLDEDVALRKRYETLRDAKDPLRAAFEGLLEQAPLARLREAIPPEIPTRQAPDVSDSAFASLPRVCDRPPGCRSRGMDRGDLAPPATSEDWRAAVVNTRTSIRTKPSLLCTPTPHCRRSS